MADGRMGRMAHGHGHKHTCNMYTCYMCMCMYMYTCACNMYMDNMDMHMDMDMDMDMGTCPLHTSLLVWRCARRRTPSESPRAPSASPAPRPARRGTKKRKGHRRLHDTVELAAEDSADVLRRLERVEIAASARTKARKGRSPARTADAEAEGLEF